MCGRNLEVKDMIKFVGVFYTPVQISLGDDDPQNHRAL